MPGVPTRRARVFREIGRDIYRRDAEYLNGIYQSGDETAFESGLRFALSARCMADCTGVLTAAHHEAVPVHAPLAKKPERKVIRFVPGASITLAD